MLLYGIYIQDQKHIYINDMRAYKTGLCKFQRGTQIIRERSYSKPSKNCAVSHTEHCGATSRPAQSPKQNLLL